MLESHSLPETFLISLTPYVQGIGKNIQFYIITLQDLYRKINYFGYRDFQRVYFSLEPSPFIQYHENVAYKIKSPSGIF